MPAAEETDALAGKSIDFNSFGKLSEKIYNSIAEKDTNISFKALETEVEKYSEYLTLDNVAGEFYFDTKYSNSPFRYVMNQDKMFQVDTLLYKIFKEGFVTCSYEYIKQLQDLSEDQFETMQSDDMFVVYKYNRINHDVFISVDTNAIKGKEKVRLQINNVETYKQSVQQQVNIYGLYSEKITGWRKFCCWFNVKRHITANYNIRYSAYLPTAPYSAVSNVSDQTVFKKHLTRLIPYYVVLPQGVTNASYSISQATGYVKIPAVTLHFTNLQ